MNVEHFDIIMYGQTVNITGDFSPGRAQTLIDPEEYPELIVTEVKLDRTVFDLDELPDDFLEGISTRFLAGEFYDDDQER